MKGTVVVSPKSIDSQTIYCVFVSIVCRIIAFTSKPCNDIFTQRDWMDITTNLPISQWYNTKEIVPNYDEIDYPPFSSYHQYLCGLFLSWVEPDSMILGKSYRYESQTFTRNMRLTILISELLIFTPSILFYLISFYKEKTQNYRNIAFLSLIILPSITIIDYERFQYNTIVFGLAAYSAIFTIKGKHRVSAVFLAFAVCYKVLTLYYSLAFAVYWISDVIKSVDKKDPHRFWKILYELSCIVISGAVPCFIIWWPWLTIKEISLLLPKFFNFNRPYIEILLEIPNFWSRLLLVIDLSQYFTNSQIAILCTVLTLGSSLPFLYLLAKNPDPKSFLYGMSGVSLCFYLFSYMVHEKAILYSIIFIALATVIEDPNLFQFSGILSGLALYSLRSYRIYYSMQIIFCLVSTYYIKYICKIQSNKTFNMYYLGILLMKASLFVNHFAHFGFAYFLWMVLLFYVFLGICYLYCLILKKQIELYRGPSYVQVSKKKE
jgi:alpha-1,3-glucosyltransferase